MKEIDEESKEIIERYSRQAAYVLTLLTSGNVPNALAREVELIQPIDYEKGEQFTRDEIILGYLFKVHDDLESLKLRLLHR